MGINVLFFKLSIQNKLTKTCHLDFGKFHKKFKNLENFQKHFIVLIGILFIEMTSKKSKNTNNNDQDLINIMNYNVNFSQLIKYSQYVLDEYKYSEAKEHLPKLFIEIQAKYKINDENIILFCKLIQDEKVSITINNYRDIFKLADFFKAKNIQNKLQQYTKIHPFKINYYIGLALDEKNDHCNDGHFDLTKDVESYLSNHINDCFLDKSFSELPLWLISNLVKKSVEDRKIQISNDLLFDFISKSIKDRYILLYYLDYQKLSDIKFDVFYQKITNLRADLYVLCKPFLQCNIEYIKSLRDINQKNEIDIAKINKENIDLKNELIQAQNQLTSMQKANIDLKNELMQTQNQIKKRQKEKEALEKNILQLQKNNDELQKNVDEVKIINDTQKEQVKTKEKEILNLNNQIKDIKKQFQENNNQKQIIIDNNESKINNLQLIIDEMMKTNNKFQNQNKELNLKVQQLSNVQKENKKLKKKLNGNNFSIEQFNRGIRLFHNSNKLDQKIGISFIERSSENGNCKASYFLGILYELGNYYQKDVEKSKFYYQKSSKEGNSHGLSVIADLCHTNPKQSFQYYLEASSLGNTYAMIKIGEYYLKGIGTEKNIQLGVENLIKSGELGNGRAYLKLGNHFASIGDISQAFSFYQESAKLKNSSALLKIGDYYYNGTHVKKDFNIAIQYYERSASFNNIIALNKLGNIYFKGEDVEQNISKAKWYFQQSAQFGNKFAMKMLAQCNKEDE